MTMTESECLQGASEPVGSRVPEFPPDWRNLRARLDAAHAARRVGLEGEGAMLHSGSFDHASAFALTSFTHALTDVNLDASEVGNLQGANCPATAGSPYRQWLR